MHGKSIRIPGPQDLRARRVVHRDPVPGEAGGGGSAGTLSATERRHETVGVRHTAKMKIRISSGPGITRILYVPPPAASRTYREKEYPSWVYAL